MIAFLNYLPVILIALGLFISVLAYQKNKREAAFITVAVTALLLVVLRAVTPSYMPKGEVPKMPITLPEAKELPPIVDRTLKPEMTEEERKKNFDEKFNAVKQSN